MRGGSSRSQIYGTGRTLLNLCQHVVVSRTVRNDMTKILWLVEFRTFDHVSRILRLGRRSLHYPCPTPQRTLHPQRTVTVRHWYVDREAL